MRTAAHPHSCKVLESGLRLGRWIFSKRAVCGGFRCMFLGDLPMGGVAERAQFPTRQPNAFRESGVVAPGRLLSTKVSSGQSTSGSAALSAHSHAVQCCFGGAFARQRREVASLAMKRQFKAEGDTPGSGKKQRSKVKKDFRLGDRSTGNKEDSKTECPNLKHSTKEPWTSKPDFAERSSFCC